MTEHNSYVRAIIHQHSLGDALDMIIKLQNANVERQEAYAEAVKGLRDAADELEKVAENGK